MRPLFLSVAGWLVLAGAARAQATTAASSSDSTGVSQLPVGQVYKQFQFPYYQNGLLKFVLTASEAKGITINRADTTDLKIDLYTNDKVTTTITSPDADLYVADRKMRTHNTVLINRVDLDATAQSCDFDLVAKQYTLRNNVKVTLHHFDAGASMSTKPNAAASATASGTPPAPPESIPRPVVPPPPTIPTGEGDGLLDSPGAYSSTNAAPLPQ